MYSLRGVDGGAEADMTVSGLQQRVLQLELSFFFGRQIQPELYPGDHITFITFNHLMHY